MNYKILIVDDDKSLLKMMQGYFKLKEYHVITAENGEEALEKIRENPDLILLDINMPKLDGIEVCRRIRDKLSCPILFLTARVEEQDRVNGLLSGGDDYILKPFSLKELDARIIAHLKREERHRGRFEYRFKNDMIVNYTSKRVQIGAEYVDLTKMEYEILEFLSMNPGQLFDKERIYEKVCGYDAEGDSRVITEMIRRIRKKFSERTEAEYIETVWGDGISMDKIKNLSIRKTIILYMSIAILGGFLIGAFATGVAERSQQAIWWKYVNRDYFAGLQQGSEAKGYHISVPRPNSYEMSRADHHLSEACDFFETYSILMFSAIGMVIAVFLFYRYKISTPLLELKAASERITRNELDFNIAYANKDEIGTLCNQFEVMRQTLYENNLCMWKMVEEQKTLRAAIAHDIRSPLAVLRGYQEMMLEFVPDDRFDKATLMEMLKEGMNQIDVLNRFVEAMRKLSSLEERETHRKKSSFDSIKNRIGKNILTLEKSTGKKAEIHFHISKQWVDIDEDMFVEVAENLLANAFSYAKDKVTVNVLENGKNLELVIMDDGCGFVEETAKLTEAYYHSNPQDDLNHFGLGMYICRLYCEKHGGKLLTANSKDGGAVVKALFSI